MKKTFAILTAVLALGACSMHQDKEPKYGSLTRSLILIDADGKRYGTIEMDPVAGGRMYDVEGRQVGTIMTPAQ